MIHTPYVMQDQVRDLVPNLMNPRSRAGASRRVRVMRSCIEIGVFLVAATAYVGALALVA